MKGSDKRKSFVESVGINGSNFKNEMLFLSFTAIIISPEMGEMAQTFISEIEWLALVNRLVNIMMMVGGGTIKIVPNNEIGFISGNRCVRVEEQTRVTTSTRARKSTRWRR